MSMMKTLARVAVGVAVAKGTKALMQGGSGGRSATSQAGGMGGLLGGLAGAMTGGTSTRNAPQGGGIEAMLGQVLGGAGAAGGGLGGLLGQLGGAGSGKGTQRSGGGGLDGLLGGLVGAGAAGGLGSMLGGMLGQGGGSAPQGQARGAGFGDLLNQAIAGQGEPETAPTDEQEQAAALMLRAMIQAAKSDGQIDAEEQARLLDKLSDATAEEMDFVRAQMAAPVDADALARDTPRGLEAQIYAMSILAIDLDSAAEAQYLDRLARALRLAEDEVNDIHARFGAPALYS